jgi:hypothetical protein
MTKLHFIYILKDELGRAFYVGKTVSPNKRFKRHLANVRYGWHYPVHNKLRKVILAKGDSDEIYEIIESNILPENADEREMFYIKFYKENGYELKNLTDGGEGGKGFTPEINKRGALKRTGLTRSSETRKRISEAKRGIVFSKAHKESLKKAWETRTPLSVEHYQKISEMNRGVINIKNFILMSPNGTIFTTPRGLTDFCRTHNLSCQNLIHTKPGGKRKHHKGWKIVGEST